jgi:VanZ family protein
VTGLLLLVIGLIVYGSLYPGDFDFSRTTNPFFILLHSWPATWDRFVLRDIAINLLLYAPLGVTAFLAAARRHSRAAAFCAAVSLGAVLTTLMELLQVYDGHRVSSLLDVTSNTLGAALGAILALCFQARWRLLQSRRIPHLQAAVPLAVCWFAYQLFPFFPVLSRTRLRAGLTQLLSFHGFSPAQVWVQAAGWFAAGLTLEALFEDLPAGWLAALTLCLPLRFFIAGRAPSLDEAIGAAAGLALWSWISKGMRLRAGLWIVLAAIFLRELEPFRLAQPPSAFSWVPFAASFHSERHPATIVLFGKVFYYGVAIWLGHARGWSYRRAGLTIAGLLAVLEWVQRYLPGRTPEITDPVLALLVAFVLWLFPGRNKKSGRPC